MRSVIRDSKSSLPRAAIRSVLGLAFTAPVLVANPSDTQQQAYIKASNTAAFDDFGTSVAMSGDTIVVGAVDESSNATGVNGDQSNNGASGSGAAYVFVRNGGTWSQQAYLKASNTQAQDEFGYSVAIDGDTIVVGARMEDSDATGVNGDEVNDAMSNSGAAYVFVRSGTTWSQQAYLKASNTGSCCGLGDLFGHSVAISGDTIVVGAFNEDSNATGIDGNQGDSSMFRAGAAYVFVRSGTTWSQQAYVKASNTQANDFFGVSVSIDGDTLVVGAPLEDSPSDGIDGNQFNDSGPNVESGAVYVFERTGTTWSQQAYVKASSSDSGDGFGSSVSISDDTFVVGAPFEESGDSLFNGVESFNHLTLAGAAYVFVRSGATWRQQAYLKASYPAAQARFGWAVAASGESVVIGAYGERGTATGINGDPTNQSLIEAGAANVFWRTGETWSHQAYVKASNTQLGDRFGYRVAASNDDFVIAAPAEDSNATGVDGNQLNNSAGESGAVYAFMFKAQPYESFCFGDGSLATPCPCIPPNTVPSPPAALGHGCANSFDLDGALLSASGTVSPDTLHIRVQVAPPNYMGFGLLLKGNGVDTNGVASSDGLRCADGALIRFGGHNAGTNGAYGGYWSYPNDVQTTPISAATLQAPGQSAYYQLFYRNAAANFCTSATTNWSSGLSVDW